MQSSHRRTPSAMPYLTKNLNIDDPESPLPSTLVFNSPQIPKPSKKDKNYLKPDFKAPKPENYFNSKFLHNHSISYNSPFCSFLSSSTENLVEEMNNIQKLNGKNNNFKANCIEVMNIELRKSMENVLETIKEKHNLLDLKRKNIKAKLFDIFCLSESSDIDTERRIYNLRFSKETVKGPGSTFQADDFSLVKFDPSIDNYQKNLKF